MKILNAIFPWFVLALGLLYVGMVVFPLSKPDTQDFDFAGFGAIPVLHNGRVKPMDTVARSYLTLLTHKQTFMEEIDTGKTDEKDKPIIEEKRRPAIRWLLDVMVALPPWGKEKVFSGPAAQNKILRIQNDEVISLVGLKERPSFRYSVNEIIPNIDKLMVQATRADKLKKTDPTKMTLYDTKVLELAEDLHTFQLLASYNIPQGIPMQGRPFEQWRPLADAIAAGMKFLQNDPASLGMVKILYAYDTKDPKTFNREVRDLHELLKTDFPKQADGVGFELIYNRFEPFHQATVLYIFAFLLGSLSWLCWHQPLNRAAFWLTVLAFVIHTWAIYARMVILGRPPVINLYSSAVFIGWCSVGVCLLMELVYRNSIPLVIGTVMASFTAGIIGHYLSLDGDTLEMLQAVLDTNFWLATHVTIITFGYSATALAGFLGIFYVFSVQVFSCIKREEATSLSKMIYGVVCFATLLSFTGTVLGGIWADQSWGRFWGWDPKENGALLIVIWNALILHARWAGMVKQQGLAVLAIAGNIVVSWSYFGTNLLGVGLHSYGFKAGTKNALIAWVLGNLLLIAVGLIPPSFWLNFKRSSDTTRAAT